MGLGYVHRMSIWRTLAEAVGLSNEANWDRVAKQRNMQRYGTQDRRDKQGPMAYFNTQGTGSAQRQATAARTPPRMVGKPGGLQIPNGTDRPGQGNPLMAPSRPSPLGTAPNAPGQGPDWLNALTGDGDGDEDDRFESADDGDGMDESRFSRLSKKLGKEKGVKDPDALAAAIGRKKYGAKKFAAMGKRGR